MNREKNKKEEKKLNHIFTHRTKLIIFALIIVIGNNIRYSKKFLIKNNKDNSFHSFVKTEKNFKPVIFNKNKNNIPQEVIDANHFLLKKELENKNLSEINKKRTFEKRYPLPEEINCSEHLKDGGLLDMMAFTSFLTKETTFFEFASGCSSIIAKYYTKKSYAVEGNQKWYDIGVANGLRNNLLFKDLKCDGSGPMLIYCIYKYYI